MEVTLLYGEKRKENMSTKATTSAHKVVSREEWIAARQKLLEAEKELMRRSDDGDCHGLAPALVIPAQANL